MPAAANSALDVASAGQAKERAPVLAGCPSVACARPSAGIVTSGLTPCSHSYLERSLAPTVGSEREVDGRALVHHNAALAPPLLTNAM